MRTTLKCANSCLTSGFLLYKAPDNGTVLAARKTNVK